MGTTQRHQRDPYEELARSFENNSVFCHVHCYDLYRQWLEAMWAFMEAYRDREHFKETLDKYTSEQGAEFGRLFGVYTDAVERAPFSDILGQIFMRLDVKSVAAGQYFSPFPIAEMMARMLFSKEEFEAKVREKGEVTVCDPAVGSGVMLLAYAKVVNDQLGREALRHVKFYGTDIDQRCVLMCRIQLRMNGLDSFGRMAGILGNLLTAHTPDEQIAQAELAAAAATSAQRALPPAAATPDDSIQIETLQPCTGDQPNEQVDAHTQSDMEDAVILRNPAAAEEAGSDDLVAAEQLTLF